MSHEFGLPFFSKNKSSVKAIEKALRKSIYIQEIIRNTRVLRAMINAMNLKRFSAKTYVIEATKPGKEMFVCAEGILEAYDSSDYYKVIGPGEVFGEMAFICNAKSKYTVRARTACKLWVLRYDVYVKILQRCNNLSDDDCIHYFQSIPIFRNLTRETLLRIRNLIRVECYEPNTPIITEGDEGSEFFIVTGGSVLVSVTGSDGREIIVERLQFGDFFGEGALLERDKRKATVRAELPGVECIILDRRHFSQFFGDMEQIKQAALDRQTANRNILDNEIEYHYINLEDLEIKGTINTCLLGRIDLVQYRSYPKFVFALKTLIKVNVNKGHFQENVYNEKNILMECRNPFIIRLYKTFKDKKYLYYLEELCIGGDLKYLIEKKENFDEKMARFVSACVLEAFDYLHSKGITYNNLKTENLVFDSMGYVKLVDFSLANKIQNIDEDESDKSLPKVEENNDAYNYDFWSLGCLIYEMLIGICLLNEIEEEKDGYIEVTKGKSFPIYVTKQAKSIIKKLWKPNMKIKDIKDHKWYQEFSWSLLQDREMQAPYIPELQSSTDLSNFKKLEKDKEIPPDDLGNWDKNF